MTRRIFPLLALALLASHSALAIEITGRVAGYVYDPTGAALSEVPLTITGPALQKEMSATTGDDGRFELANLPVGEGYTIEVNVPGFAPVRQTNVKVRLGETTPVDVHLNVLTETQAVATYEIHETVNPLLNPDSAQVTNIITAEKAAESPVFHQVEGMAQQAVGVGPGSRPSTRGGLARYTQVKVDGMDTTDISSGGITAPMNFDAVENFEILTGSMDAEYNSMGVITNIVTKSGSNKFTVDANLTLSPAFATVKNSYPANNPGYFGNYLNPTIALPEKTFYAPVLNIAGPLVKDKLWFFASYQQNFFTGDTPVSIFGKNYNRPSASTSTLGRLKLTWQATDKDRISTAFNLDRNVINNNTAFGGNGSIVTDDAENKIHRGGQFFIVNYDHNFSDSVLFQLQTGVTFEKSNTDPVYGDLDTPSHRDSTGGPTQLNYSGGFFHEQKTRMQFDPTVAWKVKAAGTHQMKAGLQYSWLIDSQANGQAGDLQYNDRGGICDPNTPATFQYCSRRTQYVGNDGGTLTTGAHVSNIGLFLQDRWSVNRQLTIIPGLRFDVGKLYGTDGTLLTNLTGLGPRLSVTYDLFADRKTLLTAHYGRSNDVGNAFIAQHGNPSLAQYTSTFANPAGFADCAHLDTSSAQYKAQCSLFGGQNGRTIAPGQAAPHVDELAFGFHHEPIEETILGIDLNFRRYGNLWTDSETNLIYDVTGSHIVGGLNGQKQSILEARTPASAYRDYKSVDIWLEGKPGHFDILGSYTLAFATGTVADYFDGYGTNPRFNQFYDGPVPDDRRHTLKGTVSYNTEWGLTLGGVMTYRTGSPLWESFSNNGDYNGTRYRSPRGTGFPLSSANNQPDFNDPNSIANLRNPDSINAGILARYNIGAPLGLKDQKAEVTLYIVNANDTSEAFGYNSQYSTTASRNTFGYSTGRTSPLQGEVILRFRN
jgi:hypothetical protein